MRGIEHEPRSAARGRETRRHARGEPGVADANPREADAAEIVDALDIGREQSRRGRGDIDEFRAYADLDFRSRGQAVVAALERDGVAVNARFAAVHLRGYDVHSGRANEIADKG